MPQGTLFNLKMGYNVVNGIKKPRLQLPRTYDSWIGEYVYISSVNGNIVLSISKLNESDVKRKISYFSNAKVKRPVIVIPDEYSSWVECPILVRIYNCGLIVVAKSE
ncbi:hypothetical protein [Methanococcus maripaludis]|uniref:Uncharacterized protein n=1 Tax=Methanococcus maripaludis TaxID=39152 RepID=A0A7J9PE06_METMI|nr:hypothetical protein [Methanococcus maripaludis]MBA2860966.1 hypothetical protein [Methanococcus maripaludis]